MLNLFLFSLLFLLTSCSMKSFVRTGYAPVCLVDYTSKTIDCSYASMNACRDRYENGHPRICFPGSNLR